MGSFITLGIEQLDVDWAKNCLGRNHSCLFLPSDLKEVTYYYAENHREQRPAYARGLRSIVKRLELLGYTLAGCRRMYAELAAHPEFERRPPIEFETLAKGLSSVDVQRFGAAEGSLASDPKEHVLASIRKASECPGSPSPPSFEMERFFCSLDPYLVLRLLAVNQANLDCEIAWRFSDLVAGGWVDEACLFRPLPASRRFLLVTEGSSDTHILKKSLSILEPEVADFFEFIDMVENYPFTGTGNVVQFCKGLAKINIQNHVLAILDNDTAGKAAEQRLAKLNLPPQIKLMVLPDLEKCRQVRTFGPSGESLEDVNGRAAAIEFFLDLSWGGVPAPAVRWSSYDKQQDAYQGELMDKETYVRAFFEGVDRSTAYDTSSLEYLWQRVLARCCGDWT